MKPASLNIIKMALLLGATAFAMPALAQDKKATEGGKVSASGEHGDGFVAEASTKIDFSETSIDGKMQAPQGFFLQGKQSQSLTQMVKLRPNFRSELRNSRSAVKSLVK